VRDSADKGGSREPSQDILADLLRQLLAFFTELTSSLAWRKSEGRDML